MNKEKIYSCALGFLIVALLSRVLFFLIKIIGFKCSFKVISFYCFIVGSILAMAFLFAQWVYLYGFNKQKLEEQVFATFMTVLFSVMFFIAGSYSACLIGLANYFIRESVARVIVPGDYSHNRDKFLKDQGFNLSKDRLLPEFQKQEIEWKKTAYFIKSEERNSKRGFVELVECGVLEIFMLIVSYVFAPSMISIILLYQSVTLNFLNGSIYGGGDPISGYKRYYMAYGIPFFWLDCLITLIAFLLTCWFMYRICKKNRASK